VGDHVVLVGMMGAGKSTTARRVARTLGRAHVDTDDEVRRRAGDTIPAIFATRGEAWFRAEEARALRAALADGPARVVSAGGGAVLDPENRRAMRAAGTVVWLRARPETLARRLPEGGTRPLLVSAGEEPAAVLARIDAERRVLYEEVATAVVDVDGLRPEEVVTQVVGCVSPRASTGDAP
jgi:shikimate kinase